MVLTECIYNDRSKSRVGRNTCERRPNKQMHESVSIAPRFGVEQGRTTRPRCASALPGTCRGLETAFFQLNEDAMEFATEERLIKRSSRC